MATIFMSKTLHFNFSSFCKSGLGQNGNLMAICIIFTFFPVLFRMKPKENRSDDKTPVINVIHNVDGSNKNRHYQGTRVFRIGLGKYSTRKDRRVINYSLFSEKGHTGQWSSQIYLLSYYSEPERLML